MQCIYFHALCQCDVVNVNADDVRKWGCGCDVVVTKSGEAVSWLGTWKNQQFATLSYFLPSLYDLLWLIPSFIFISLLIPLCFGFCRAAVLVFCGFYWFLHSVLLYSQHSRFSLWVTGAKKLASWAICWMVDGLKSKYTECQDVEIDWIVLKFS